MKNNILPDKLINALRGFSHVMGVYLDRSCYQRERLLYYQADSDFRKIGIDDHACRLLSKIKLIALNKAFDQYAEQELGLIIGLFNREQTKKQYDIISVDENLYYSMKLKFSSFREKELVHLLAISPVAKKSIWSITETSKVTISISKTKLFQYLIPYFFFLEFGINTDLYLPKKYGK